MRVPGERMKARRRVEVYTSGHGARAASPAQRVDMRSCWFTARLGGPCFWVGLDCFRLSDGNGLHGNLPHDCLCFGLISAAFYFIQKSEPDMTGFKMH